MSHVPDTLPEGMEVWEYTDVRVISRKKRSKNFFMERKL